jgi:hypothetical protein
MGEVQRIAAVEGGGRVSEVGLVSATARKGKVEAENPIHKDERQGACKGYEIRETEHKTNSNILDTLRAGWEEMGIRRRMNSGDMIGVVAVS